MQKDFHFATTYTLARLAGFDKNQAEIISTSSQYIDDATHSGKILFKNRAGYQFFSSAHKMLDYRNFKELANHYSWIPFHFLPGNITDDPLFEGADPFIQKLICQPNSMVAKLMVEKTIQKKHKRYSLYQLGIAMHVYADTWAHQKFCGISHKVNDVGDILDIQNNLHEHHYRAKKYFKKSLWKRFISWLVGEVQPLGHGPALSMPDKPYAKWQYINFQGLKVTRDNTEIYMDAVDKLFSALVAYKNGESNVKPTSLLVKDRENIYRYLSEFTSDDEEERTNQWIEKIAAGNFSFGAETPIYKGAGSDSWYNKLNIILPKKLESKTEDAHYSNDFLTSDWKLFHDALVDHRAMILHEILPTFKITVA